MKNIAIQIENLKKHFDEVKAVDGISFEVKPGECFGLLGPNGAGKTTTINMLVGLLDANDGQIRINGHLIPKDLKKMKPDIGICPQSSAIFGFLSARENIDLFGNLYNMDKERLKSRMEELLIDFQLEEASTRKTKTFSGGMLRRLNLIIAMIHDPRVLFLDEPTQGMDPQSRRMFWDYVEELKKQGKTIVLTTHYMEEAEKLSDRVGIIDYGKIIELDSPENLMNKFKVSNLEDVFIELTGRKIREDS